MYCSASGLSKTSLKLGNNLFVFCTLFKIHIFVSVIYFCLIEILTLICDSKFVTDLEKLLRPTEAL